MGREGRRHLFPRLQAAGSRMGYREGLPSTSMQGCPAGLVPPGMGSRGSWLGAEWIEGLRVVFQDLCTEQAPGNLGEGGNEARKGGSVPMGRWGVHPSSFPPPD